MAVLSVPRPRPITKYRLPITVLGVPGIPATETLEGCSYRFARELQESIIEVVLGNGGAVVGGIGSFYTRLAANLKCWDGYQLPKTYATFELVFGVASLFVGDLVFVEDSMVEVSVFAACLASLLPVGVLPLPLPLP